MEGLQTSIQVALLSNHQAEIDGIRYRLAEESRIRIVGVSHFGSHLASLLAREPADVLLADRAAPTAPENPKPYLHLRHLMALRGACPALKIVMISSRNATNDTEIACRQGIHGYILKEDRDAWIDLAAIIRQIAAGRSYFSAPLEKAPIDLDVGPHELTSRQLEVLDLLTEHPDMTTHEVALQLDVANSTVRNLLSQAYTRLGVSTRAAAIARLRHRR